MENQQTTQNHNQESPDDRGFEQLKLLFDYTKFHIGLYAAVATIFATLVTAKGLSDKQQLFSFNRRLLFLSVFFLCIAGLAGGVVAGTIPYRKNIDDFLNSPTAPLREGWGLRGSIWTKIEHVSFWLAVLVAFLAGVCG
jgi:hypothetical protein